MKIHSHRAVDPFSSRSSPHAGRRRSAALAAALAVLILSTAPAGAAPSFIQKEASRNAPEGTMVSVWIGSVFDNAGSTPRFTNATLSTLEYCDVCATIGANDTRIFYRAKTDDELNAMSPPPPTPFTVTLDVTMSNEEGETGSGTLSLKTQYTRVEPPAPSLSKTTANAPAGLAVSAFAEYFFQDAGTNPQLTEATFSTMEYYVEASTGVSDGLLDIKVKTSDELNDLDPPPPNPFTVQVTLTMTNDEGQTATGTVDYSTDYEKDE